MTPLNRFFAIAALVAGNAAAEPSGDKVLFPTEEEQGHHRNYVAGFVGYTSEERGEGGLTIGAEFSHRFSKHTGAGVIVERVLGDIDSWVAVAAAGYRTERWKFYGGVGFDDPEGGRRETLIRIGTTHVIPWTRTKEFLITGAVDAVDGEYIWLLGAALGYGF